LLCSVVAIVVLGQLTQAIRNFAKNLEGWLKNALVGAPEDIIRIKVSDLLLQSTMSGMLGSWQQQLLHLLSRRYITDGFVHLMPFMDLHTAS